MKQIKNWGRILQDTAKELGQHDPLVLASSTAFFTVFSLAPIIIIVVNALSLYFIKSKQVTSPLFDKIENTFGADVADQVEKIVSNFEQMSSSPWITVIQSVFFVFVATNLFKIIRLSINRIWNLRKKKEKYNFVVKLKKRGVALLIILLTGVLFLLSNLSDVIVNAIGKPLQAYIPDFNFYVIFVVSKIFSLLFVTLWFAGIFRYLPDARMKWKVTLIGAGVTAVLFTIGKFILEEVLIKGGISNIFETSTTIVLLLLFIFYSSLIMYFGATFIKVYNQSLGRVVKPRKYAERYSWYSEKEE